MKKLILLALTSLIMVGCLSQEEKSKMFAKKYNYVTVEIDGCEYLFAIHGYKGFLAHKGNCCFCEARRKQELKELVEQLKDR